MPKNFIKTLLIIIFSLNLLNACGIYRPVDMKDEPATAKEKRRKNIDEGKGISLKGIVGNRSTNFEFSTSNPLWRASLEILDFMPLSTVDYAGGIIITDWYNDKNNINESLKISIRFLTNEVRSDSLKITIYEKKCSPQKDCYSQVLNSKIKDELVSSIIKKAALLEKEIKKN